MTIWDELLLRPRFQITEVNETVKNFMEVFNMIGDELRCLDLGCGNGRHTVFFAEHGWSAFGVDQSEIAIQATEQNLLRNGLLADVRKASYLQLPFEDNFFDVVVCINVLHHDKISNIRCGIKEIWRVMNERAKALISIMSINDFRIKDGIVIEPNTLILKNDIEEGIIHHFFDKEEIVREFHMFNIANINEEINHHHKDKPRSRWFVTVCKGE